MQVQNLNGVIAVAAGGEQSLALKSDGTVWAWGRNDVGQLGDGTTAERHTPVQVHTLNGVTAIAAGQAHNLALKSDGTVWAWGGNDAGQLGDGTTTTPRPSPVQVHNLNGVTCVDAGDNHSLARKSDGTVWAWGGNGDGQLGDGNPTSFRPSPVQVHNLSGSPRSPAVRSTAWRSRAMARSGRGVPTILASWATGILPAFGHPRCR